MLGVHIGGPWELVPRLGRDCELAEGLRALALQPGLSAVAREHQKKKPTASLEPGRASPPSCSVPPAPSTDKV